MLYAPLQLSLSLDQKQANASDPPAHNINLISEIVVPKKASSLQLVLPSLAYLSRNNNEKWLTWITDSPLPISLLQHFEFNLSHLRVVYAKDSSQMKGSLIKVLQDNSSHCVVANPGKLTQQELQHLELSAQIGGTRAVLVRFNEL